MDPSRSARSAHVIVVGNEKGGSGKSTTAIHIAIALLKAGRKVATVDLDTRQKSFTRYIENRAQWAAREHLKLEMPSHFCGPLSDGVGNDMDEQAQFTAFADILAAVEQSHDVVVIDTPGADTYLMRLAHAMADTLITPLNDSFVDFDVLGTVDARSHAVIAISHYAEMVRGARIKRGGIDQTTADWIVVRNRLSNLSSRNKRLLADAVSQLSSQLDFRIADGFSERVVYREFFPRGLTALDTLDEATLGTRPNMSHVAARQEVQALLAALRLPMQDKAPGGVGATVAADSPLIPENSPG